MISTSSGKSTIDHEEKPAEVLAAVANPAFGEPLDSLGRTFDGPERPAPLTCHCHTGHPDRPPFSIGDPKDDNGVLHLVTAFDNLLIIFERTGRFAQ